MKRLFFVPALGVAIAAWSPASFAQQVINGATPTPLSVTGGTSGVSMTGQGGGGTLLVGTIGGPQSDIFTNNSSAGAVTNPLLRAVSTDTSSQSNIVFNSSSNVYGALGITNPGGPFFLNINGGNNGTADNFLGNLYGTTTTVSGTGSLNFNSGSTNITATNFAADGTISLAPNSKLTGALTTNAARTGTLVLGGGSALTGAVGGATGLKTIGVVGGSNSAGVSASINGAVNAYTFNLGTNTLNVGGALTIANSTPAGAINTTLASPTVYGNITTTGATNLGPTLLVNVAVPQTAFFPVGTQFNIVKTQSGTNGTVVTVVNDPTNPLYTFSAVPLAGTVNGAVTIITTGIPLTVPVAPPAGVVLPPVAAVAAPVVPAILAAAPGAPPPSDLIVTVLPAINAISDAPTVVNAIAQLAPSNADLSAPLVTFEGAREFQNLLSSRLDDSLCSQGSAAENQRRPDDKRRAGEGASGCPDSNKYDGVWLKGFGYFGNQGAHGAFPGYSAKIFGAMAGYDTPVADKTRAGAAIGYARSTINGKAFITNTGFSTYQGMLYIEHEDDDWIADGNVSYGWNDYSKMRHIIFPGIDRTATAKYSGNALTGYLLLGRHFYMEDLEVTPSASLQVTHVDLGAYNETGAGDLNLNTQRQDYAFLQSTLGVNVERSYSLSDATDALPQLHLKWLHELFNPTMQQVATFAVAGSPSFTSAGLSSAADTLNVGASVTVLSCVACSVRTWSVEAAYDYYWRNDNYSAHRVMLEIADRF